jgi:hypothetical protein
VVGIHVVEVPRHRRDPAQRVPLADIGLVGSDAAAEPLLFVELAFDCIRFRWSCVAAAWMTLFL